MKKLSVSLSGHNTSITLEDQFIDVLRKIADTENTSVSAIINSIDKNRKPDSNLSSEIRIWILHKLLKTSKL
ncbi:MAG TPA: ribbon-helix-helix domain-containing protein [Alphaproteobacteria bacterium]|jgi:predicted DNA-binding ribbon-helix-helix protein|nr:ribbon-helix-helix domain-containing protein [Alphaproteobacteria bacterium]